MTWTVVAPDAVFTVRTYGIGRLTDLFERRFSVDETVRRHKPAQEAYHSVAAALGLDPGDICPIASHVWDTIGASAAGWQSALIVRAGNAPLDVGPQPDYIGKDLDAIAGQLIGRYPAEAGAPPAVEGTGAQIPRALSPSRGPARAGSASRYSDSRNRPALEGRQAPRDR